jgi:uroporphyrinogen-III synthase
MRLLITRPQDDALKLAQQVSAQGHDCVMAPVIYIVARDVVLPSPENIQGLAFTSANGVRALSQQLGPNAADWLRLPAYTVGPQTQQAALAAGFGGAQQAAGDVESLADLIASQQPAHADKPILHIAGSHLAGNLQALLAAHNISVEKAVLYEAQAATDFEPPVANALRRAMFDAVVIYSQRSARIFIDLFTALEPTARRKPVAFCLSPAIARLMQAAGFEARTAAAADEPAMLDLLQENA